MTDRDGDPATDDAAERSAVARAVADLAREPAPYDRAHQIFPVLSDHQLRRASAFGRREAVAAGTRLFSRGDRVVDLFIVLSGTVEIVDEDSARGEGIVTVHRAGEFTGELDHFSSRRILVTGRMGTAGEVLRFDRDAVRKLMIAEPEIGEIVIRAFILRRVALIDRRQGAVTVVGPRRDAGLIAIERFLARNGQPRRVLDPADDAEGRSILDSLPGLSPPIVLCGQGTVLERPTTFELAAALGLLEEIDGAAPYDVAVVGAGPAGLAAAVYGASEGLSTIVLEVEAPGGQAGTSSRIENYLGFPTGISGQALAGRAQVQAQKFGATIAVPRQVVSVDCDVAPFRLALADGATVLAHTIVIASGARYRKPPVADFDRFEGSGIHYAATALEADLCRDEAVIVVGGGNSAGQAAVFLSRHARHVHVLVRGDGLAATMSSYLIGRIEASDRITLHVRTEIAALHGKDRLERVDIARSDGTREALDVRNVFVMIGAAPNTEWLSDCIALDPRGFVLTGAACRAGWPLEREPFILETSRPGVFAAGDVRSGSVKRVASAVGEGSIAVQFLHAVLSERMAAAGGGRTG